MNEIDPDRPLGRGYSRASGRPGIRNKLLILYTVECSKHVCLRIEERFRAGRQVDCVGNEACAKNDVVLRELFALIRHPNTGAVLVVGMGCEEIRVQDLLSVCDAAGKPRRSLLVQDAGGTESSIAFGIRLAEELLSEILREPDTDLYWRDLCVGAECGSSDFSSTISANPLVGTFMDYMVAAGGTGVIGEMAETVGLRDAILARAANEHAAMDLALTYDKMLAYCRKTGRFSISPGNYLGGLSTIEEKSVGAFIKSGHSPLSGILKLGQNAPDSGMWIVDEFPDFLPSPDSFRGGDASSMLHLAAAGCQLVFLTTGRGHVAGIPLSPVIKITGNRETFRRMNDDIDFDASPVTEGEESPESALRRLVGLVRATISGAQTFSEQHGVNLCSIPFSDQLEGRVIDRLYY